MSRKLFLVQPCPPPNDTPGSPVLSRGVPHKPRQLGLFDPTAVPFWTVDPVHPTESLPGQRYRLTLVHGDLRRAVPAQLSPHEADVLFEAVRAVDADWRLDPDKGGSFADRSSAETVRVLFGALLSGGVGQ